MNFLERQNTFTNQKKEKGKMNKVYEQMVQGKRTNAQRCE
jgi:hypothetical protein